jgi:hypothetical protein
LIEERREEVVVLPVDEHHIYRLAPERLRALEPAEAGPDDDDTRMRAHAADCRMNASPQAYLFTHRPAQSAMQQ